MSTDTPDDPRTSPVVVILRTIFAPLVVVGRVVYFLWVALRAWLAVRRTRAACRHLGERIYSVEMGDLFIRDRVAVAKQGLSERPAADRRRVLTAELDEALELLGRSGVSAGEEVLGAEREYKLAHAAITRRNAATAARAAASAGILPHTGLGWIQLIVGCFTTGGLIYLALSL